MEVTNLLIAVPAYGGAVKTGCVDSLLRLEKQLVERGYKIRFDFTSFAEVTAVRNLFGTMMVENPHASHLLFIDTDMEFRPESVFRLIDAQKPVIGCFYSRRSDDRTLVGVVDKPTPVPEDGLIEAAAIGMGLCLIEGDVFKEMAATGELTVQKNHPFPKKLRGPLLGFFNSPTQDSYLSEDIAFCRRYTELTGKKIYALAREQIGHVGDKSYSRNLNADMIIPLAESE